MKQELIEKIPCPSCGALEFISVLPAKYPEGIGREQLAAIYRSSSNHQLLDQLSRCVGCGLLYLNPRVNAKLIMEGYESAIDPTFFQQNELRVRTFIRYWSDINRRFRLKEHHKLSILDIGCAGGAFIKAAANLGFQPIGIEPSRWLAQRGKEEYGLDIRPGTIEEQNFSPESFDVITLWDVIEHLTDPHSVIARASSLLRKGGILVVNYPDYDSLTRRVLGVRWPFLLNVHLIYFTPSTISNFLAIHGFRPLLTKPFFQTLELGYVLERATAYFSVFGVASAAVRSLRLDHWPITYNMGQRLLVAEKT